MEEAICDNYVEVRSFAALKRVVADYINLMKPGVLSLLLVSTCCPMLLAAGGEIETAILIYALVGGYLISASASVFNCIWDRDIDAIMERTKNRPLAAGRVTVPRAFVYGVVLGIVGFTILWFGLNPLAASISLFGHFFYVFIYTIWLKRSTPQNIVIGGAAGAIPPIVGWVGVTNHLSIDAILLFFVIFLWTPPHFWALALNKNSDYRRAGVPMLPVVSGEAETVKQMLWYALSLIPVSAVLVYSNKYLGMFSLFALAIIGIVFSFKVYQLKQLIAKGADLALKTKKAWDVFGFSLIYLALFFVFIVFDAFLSQT
ncbi:MAG: heme o synthase [Proteobacteria bacterium]|nr:heme o synthase [Pseudomonadota bacterium]